MFNRKPKSRMVGQRAVLRDSDLNAQQQQLSALSASAVSVTAAREYDKAIAKGVNKATENNAEPLVKSYRDGGFDPTTARAGVEQQNAKDTTVPQGRDATRDSRKVGQYAAAITDRSRRRQSKGRYARGDNR